MLYMCDFELEYNLSMRVYRYMYLYIRASNDATLFEANFLDSVTLHSNGGGDFPRKSTNFKDKSRELCWVEMLPGCSKLLGTLGGGPQTRVNETHLDQRLVNGLFHLYL